MKRPPTPALPDLHKIAVKAARPLRALTEETLWRVPLNVPVRQIHRNVYTTDTDTRAVFTLADTTWSNQSADIQGHVVALATAAWAALPGRHLKFRIAERPVDGSTVGAYKDTAPDPHPLWESHVEAGADRQIDIGLTDTSVTVDVRLCGAHSGERGEDWETHHAEVLAQLSNQGLRGAPAPEGLVDWLVHTSVAPGHPVPEFLPGRACDDVDEFTAEVEWWAPVRARAVQITSGRGEPVWAAALTVSTITARETPGPLPPWMSACLHAPFPVQLVVSGEVTAARDAAAVYRNRADWQADNIDHLRKHKLPVPDSVHDAHEEARRLADQLTAGAGDADKAQCRFVGRLVVVAPTRTELDDRCRYLQNLYRDDVHVVLVRALDQVTALSELSPGVREITAGYQRNGDVALLSGAVPNATGQIGQDIGMDFGYTSGSLARRVVRFDPWHPSERLNKAPIYPVLGDLGAGRSTLGLRVIQECTLAGNYVVAVDPAGEWTNVNQLPGGERIKVIDLSGQGPETAGLLSTDRLVPDPDPADFGDPYDGGLRMDELRAAKERATATRVALATDNLQTLVGDDTWANEPRRWALQDAARDADGYMWGIVDWLNRSGDDGNRRLARELTVAAHGTARLLFPPRGVDAPSAAGGLLDAQVVVITMQGMQFPAPSVDQKHWTSEERAGALTMRLAAFLAKRLIEVRPRRSRKALIVDEASWIANWSAGRAWIADFVRHVRRWNTALFLMTQHPEDLRKLDPEGTTFACGGFIGTTDRAQVAAASLALVGAAPGLEPVLKQLSWMSGPEGRQRVPGEFFYVDADERAERVRLDLDAYPELKAVASTTPGASTVALQKRRARAVAS